MLSLGAFYESIKRSALPRRLNDMSVHGLCCVVSCGIEIFGVS